MVSGEGGRGRQFCVRYYAAEERAAAVPLEAGLSNWGLHVPPSVGSAKSFAGVYYRVSFFCLFFFK